MNNFLAGSEAFGGKRQNDELNKGGCVGTGSKVQYAIMVHSKHDTSMLLLYHKYVVFINVIDVMRKK